MKTNDDDGLRHYFYGVYILLCVLDDNSGGGNVIMSRIVSDFVF